MGKEIYQIPGRWLFAVTTCLTALFLLLANISIAWSVELGPVNVDARIDNTKPTLGDVITYSITVTHDPDIVLHMPEYVIPEGLEKVENDKRKAITNNQQNSQEFWLKLRIDKTGPLTLPAIPVWFDAPDQNKKLVRGKILTPAINFEVQSLLKLEANASDIKDIKPLADIQAPWAHYIWKGLGVLCLLALAYFLWKKWQKKSNKQPETIIALTAEQQALKELQELKKHDWMKLGRVRDHFFELSEIFRRYLENRYHFPAQEWTTEEIITHFKSFSDLSDSQKLQARTILAESDKVKFAKAEVEAHYDPIEPVTQFIKEVTPAPVGSEETISGTPKNL
ncbi:MAG: hypothetical protein H8E32_03775 [Nitrospinae bacterium]|nr:hypothetical protein [Nitrospinota bacterium]